MIHPDAPPQPAWIILPNGRLIPFESDRICEDLYLASVKMGNPDAFLIRELTDGVVFTLASENPGATLKLDFLVQAVTNSLRNFGHSELSATYNKIAFNPSERSESWDEESVLFKKTAKGQKSLSEVSRQKMLHSVFTPDISGAIQDGWIQMAGLTFPDGLLSATWTDGDWLGLALHQPDSLGPTIRALAARNILLDSPEIHAQHLGLTDPGKISLVLQRLEAAFLSEGVSGILHLNNPRQPGWFRFLVQGPLFSQTKRDDQGKDPLKTANAFLRAWISLNPSALRLHWHRGERELADTGKILSQLARSGRPWAFSSTKNLTISWLSKGVTQEQPAVLDKVYLRLDRLAKACRRKGILDKFPERLPSLIRLGISAGNQKRAFLRRLENHRRGNETPGASLGAGFQLEKARLVIAPRGLPELLDCQFPGAEPNDEKVLQLARVVLKEIRQTLLREDPKSTGSLVLDLSHLLDVKESRIKELMDRQLDQPRSICFGSKRDVGEWLNAVGQPGDWIDLANPQAPEGEMDWLAEAEKWPRIHAISWPGPGSSK
ncbi:MAG: hypothetical protein EXR99_03525 [Gemmataceae bacterium]|nr:hypothetical protein [Gemmataceae bacterium]